MLAPFAAGVAPSARADDEAPPPRRNPEDMGLCPCIEAAVVRGDLEAPACFARYAGDPAVGPDRELLQRLKGNAEFLRQTQGFWQRRLDRLMAMPAPNSSYSDESEERPIIDPKSVPKSITFGNAPTEVRSPAEMPKPKLKVVLPPREPKPSPQPSPKPDDPKLPMM